MAKIFITGSADGLGQLTAKALIKNGHEVVLHARNQQRAEQAMAEAPGAKEVLIADLSSIEETKALANQTNALGTFDAVIHNAGVYQGPANALGHEGLPLLLTVNSLAPYILTCLMKKPSRLIYLSSDMHRQGNPNKFNLIAGNTDVSQNYTYSDTKLHDLMLALTVARLWPDVLSNAVDPGWVPTKMGGIGAPNDLQKGYETQLWLASSADAQVSGQYFHHKKETNFLNEAANAEFQDKYLAFCAHLTGVNFI